jgi:transposase-like protein
MAKLRPVANDTEVISFKTAAQQINKAYGYHPELRQKAIRRNVDGMYLRRTTRQLGIHNQTVANWVKEYAEKLTDAPVPEKIQTAEMDELFTFIGEKKTGSTSSQS